MLWSADGVCNCLRSVGASEDPGATGGADSVTLTESQLPAHAHTFTTDPDGDHSHTLFDGDPITIGYGIDDVCQGVTRNEVQSTFAAPQHTHTGTTDQTGSGQAIENRPAHFELAFIMKM